MVLAQVDNFTADFKFLHHRRARSAQVVRCPLHIPHYKTVVLNSELQFACPTLEFHLPVTHLFADRLDAHMPLVILCREGKEVITRQCMKLAKFCVSKI